MRKVVFDIETKNFFHETGSNDPASLDISLVCAYDYETDAYSSYLESELPKLWPLLEQADMLIGFNSDHFDIPLLNKYYSGDLTRIKSLDLMAEIKKSLGRRVGLEAVAQGSLGRGKIADGFDAVRWFKEGKIDELRKYCIEDVKLTKDVYDYAFKNKKVKIKNNGGALDVSLDTSAWEEKTGGSLTFSLPF
jgi:DEAD/DEAH box helicase domain-containing protein